MMRPTRPSFIHLLRLVLAVAIATPALAQHEADVAVTVVNDRIETGIWQGAQFVTPFPVHAATFGDSGFDGFTSNPGFDAPPGTFAPGSRIGFNVLDALQVWDGAAFVPAVTETLTITFFSLNVETGPGPVPGFDIAVSANGSWHKHLGFTLEPFGAAPDGIYLLAIELYSDDSGITHSPPLSIVFRNDAVPGDEFGTAEAHAAAIAWAEQSLGCPADLDGSGDVGFSDILAIITRWGDACGPCPEDLDGSGDVGFGDILAAITEWGPCD